jgi:transposase InsO family protein
MSRKANCWDNAPMESFSGTLKTELVHHHQYADRDTARRELFAYIEGYYNRGGSTPPSATSPHSRQRQKAA